MLDGGSEASEGESWGEGEQSCRLLRWENQSTS